MLLERIEFDVRKPVSNGTQMGRMSSARVNGLLLSTAAGVEAMISDLDAQLGRSRAEQVRVVINELDKDGDDLLDLVEMRRIKSYILTNNMPREL